MCEMGSFGARLLKDERGSSLVDYGLIAALFILAMIAVFTQVATATTTWNNVDGQAKTA